MSFEEFTLKIDKSYWQQILAHCKGQHPNELEAVAVHTKQSIVIRDIISIHSISDFEVVDFQINHSKVRKTDVVSFDEIFSEVKRMDVSFDDVIKVFDLLNDIDKLGDFLAKLSDEQRDKLYNHPLLSQYDLLP
jgi:hypothetical protein